VFYPTFPTSLILEGSLRFKDETSWVIKGRDDNAKTLALKLKKTMKMEGCTETNLRNLFYLTIETDSKATTKDWVSLNYNSQILFKILEAPRSNKKIAFITPPITSMLDLVGEMISLSLLFSLSVLRTGGMLLHGALAEYHGKGVILLGRGGMGKTTASNRLVSPWRSLSDDGTIVVRDPAGKFWAHPWPTWSNLSMGHAKNVWDVNYGIPLESIFLLSWEEEPEISQPNPSQAIAELIDRTIDCFWGWHHQADKALTRKAHRLVFQNACELFKHVPCYTLGVTPDNIFWKPMEKTIG